MTSKTIFISGASSGLGLAIAEALVGRGWRVFGGALPTDNLADLERIGATPLPIDITQDESVRAAMDALGGQLGDNGLSALVNNAGVMLLGAIETTPIADIQRAFEVNLFGHIRVIQACLPFLRAAQGARIINTSSVLARFSTPFVGVYSMSKHALQALTQTLYFELGASHIHVIAIEPGTIRTPLVRAMPDQADAMWARLPQDKRAWYAQAFSAMRQQWAQQWAVGNEPEVIAQAVLHALETPNPQPRYTVGADVRSLPLLLRLLPEKRFLNALKKRLGIP